MLVDSRASKAAARITVLTKGALVDDLELTTSQEDQPWHLTATRLSMATAT